MDSWSSQCIESKGDSTVIKISRISEENKRQGVKRKNQTVCSPESKKTKIMNKDEMRALLLESASTSAITNKLELEETKKEILNALDSKLDPVVKDVAELKDQYTSFQQNSETQAQDISVLRKEMQDMKDNFQSDVLKVVGEQGASENSTYKFNLASIVERANNNIIIHGLKTDLVKEDVEKLFSSLNIPPQNAPKVVSVVQLGKGDGSKVPSILVILQNQYQRNEILRQARNLPQEVKLDRDIPQGYREAYKRMRRQAWKYKNFFKITTQIVFTGHLMQLRYKDLDNATKKSFTIVDEFYPRPEQLATPNTGNSVRPGTIPSTSLSKSALEEAKDKVLMTGVGKKSKTEVEDILRKVMKSTDFECILDIEIEQGNAILKLRDKVLSKQIATKYSGKNVGNFKVSLETI